MLKRAMRLGVVLLYVIAVIAIALGPSSLVWRLLDPATFWQRVVTAIPCGAWALWWSIVGVAASHEIFGHK